MSGISTRNSACWRTRLKQCMDERSLTQLDFVHALNRQYLTKFHQKDVSRWLNTGNRTSSGGNRVPQIRNHGDYRRLLRRGCRLPNRRNGREDLCHEPCLRIYRFKQQLHRRRPVMDRDTTGTAEEQSHARWRPDARISRRHHQPSAVVAQVPRAGNETADIAGNVGNLEQQSAKI